MPTPECSRYGESIASVCGIIHSSAIHFNSRRIGEETNASGEMTVVFQVEMNEEGGRGRRESGEGWGLVGGLQEGVEYEFSVTAEVVADGSERLEGAKTQPVTVTVVDTSGE